MKIKIKYAAEESITAFLEVERREPVSITRARAAEALSEVSGQEFPTERLSLLYAGKQLADGMDLFDYNVKHGVTIVAMLRRILPEAHRHSVADSESDSVISAETLVVKPTDSKPADDAAVEGKVSKAADEGEKANDAEESEIPPTPCNQCSGSQNSKCTTCGCYMCGGKDEEHTLLVCDECGHYFHMRCLPVPLTELPKEDDWYCHMCINDPSIVIAGEKKLDLSNSRKAKMPSAKQTKKWGRGKACAGTTKTCTVVPKDHIGPIPGVRVGQSWQYRIQVSESGVHRPPVSGIAGSSTKAAQSIVLAGGYPEDEDRGEEFLYTGSGGYDLSGNKRQARVQTFDQQLVRQNLSLALACAAPVNEVKGGEAKDWKQSSPIRVCRSYKIAKMHPEFAPAEGVRYDGIYRIVKYWREKGVSGFYVWRYLFRRDDPEPAPWTEEGRANIERLGLVMYKSDDEGEGDDTKGKAASTKRATAEGVEAASASKRSKAQVTYVPAPELAEMIRLDKENSRLWTEVMAGTYTSESAFLENLSERELMCPICQDLVQQPCTTPCAHNICSACLVLSLKKYGDICPICRHSVAGMGSIEELRCRSNEALVNVLQALIPTYGQDWEAKVKNPAVEQRAIRTGMAIEEAA
ncbi:hypothetical protein GGI07_002668 [Coemansia sp. Benny D115]|nr:hypothetical protein GGI07_002668 [Coemansia sp. Benny D115]